MVFIVRHGQTKLNRMHILQGRSDHPLNEDGRSQAEALKGFFERQGIKFDRVYSSPLIRAEETARILSLDSEIVKDDRLIEMDYGPYEGMDLSTPVPEIKTFFSDFVNNPAPEGMEPLGDIVARVREVLEEIKGEAAERNILISTHAIAMKAALEYLTPDSGGRYWSEYIGNCAVYVTEVVDGKYTVPVEYKKC